MGYARSIPPFYGPKNFSYFRNAQYFGWLSSSVPGYLETLNLKTMVHTRKVGVRPRIELEPTDHPLAVEQREGITWERVREIAEIVLHGGV